MKKMGKQLILNIFTKLDAEGDQYRKLVLRAQKIIQINVFILTVEMNNTMLTK